MNAFLSLLLAAADEKPDSVPQSGAGWPEWIAAIGFVVVIAVGIAAAFFAVRKSGKGGSDWREGIREWLAIAIVGVGILTVGVIGTFALLVAENDGFRDKVLSAIFPLLGAWVGAVIAYYFAKENLEAATRSTKELLTLDERLRTTTVSEVMIDVPEIEGKVVVADKNAIDALKVVELQQQMTKNRAPILDAAGKPLLIVHKATLAEYITGKVAAGEQNTPNLTLGDFRKETEPWAHTLWTKLLAFATVRPKASLSEAKNAMESKGIQCADIFVTQDGTADSAVVGWITNVDLGRASRP